VEPEDAGRVLGHTPDQRRVERRAGDDPLRPIPLDAEQAHGLGADPDAAVATPHEPPHGSADHFLRDRDEFIALDATQTVRHPDPDAALWIRRHAADLAPETLLRAEPREAAMPEPHEVRRL